MPIPLAEVATTILLLLGESQGLDAYWETTRRSSWRPIRGIWRIPSGQSSAFLDTDRLFCRRRPLLHCKNRADMREMASLVKAEQCIAEVHQSRRSTQVAARLAPRHQCQ